jgi:hypothetical protein
VAPDAGGLSLNIFRFSNDTDPEGGFNDWSPVMPGVCSWKQFGAPDSPSFVRRRYTFHP